MISRRRIASLALVALLVGAAIPGYAAPKTEAAKDSQERSRDFFLAYRMYQDKMYELAATELLEFAHNNPGHVNSGEALYLAGESLFNVGDYDQARGAYLECAIEYPLDSRVILALTRVADCWERLKKPYEAGEAYFRVYMQAPGSEQAAKVLLNAGKSYVATDSLSQARDVLETYLDRFSGMPGAVEATVMLAEISDRMGSPEGAESLFSRAFGDASVDSVKEQVLWRWFQTVHRDGDYVSSLKVGDRLVAKFPRSALVPAVQCSLGEMALMADDAAEAERRLTESLKSKDSPRDTKWLRAIARYERRNWDGVLEDVRNETSVAAQLMKALALKEKGQFDQARGAFVDCMSRNWGGPYGLKALEQLYDANIVLTSDELKRIPGLGTLSDSVDISHWGRYWLGVIPGDAIFPDESLVESLIRNPHNSFADDVLYSRAGWNLRRGSWEDAYQDFSLLPVKFPSSEWVISSQLLAESLTFAAVPDPDRFDALGDLLAQQAVSKAPVSSNDIAWCYFRQFKYYEKSSQWFQRTLAGKQSPSDQVAEAQFGSTLSALYQLRLDLWMEKTAKGQKPDSLISAAFGQLKASDALADYRPLMEQAVTMFQEEFQQKTLPISPIIKWLTVPNDSTYSNALVPSFQPILIQYHLGLASEDPKGQHRRIAMALLEDEAGSDSEPIGKRWAMWQIANLTLSDTTITTAANQLKELARSPGPFQVEAALELVEELATPEERIRYLVAARENTPYHRDYRKLSIALGDQYFQAKRYDDALRTLSDIDSAETLTSDPFVRFTLSTDDLEYKLGSAFRALGRHDEAMVHFRRYLQLHQSGPTAEAALYALGRTEEDRGFPTKASDYYRHLHEISPGSDNDRLAMIRTADILWRSNDYDNAAKAYQDLKTQFPKSEDAMEWEYRRIMCLYRSGNSAAGNAAAAQFEKDYKKQAGFDDLNAELDLESGKAMAKANQAKEAEKVFDGLAKKYSGKSMGAAASFELGKLRLKWEKPDAGLAILTKIPSQYPKDPILPDVYVALGVFYYQNQQMDNALSAFQSALASVQDEPEILKDVLNNLVVVYRDLGLWEAALSALERSIALYPDDDTVTRRLEQGQFLIHIGETDRAVEVLKKQLNRAQGDDLQAVQFYIGEAYFQKGMYAKAAAEYMKVVYAEVESKLDWVVTAIYQAGQCYERMGKPDAAIAMYRDIIKRQGRESPYSRGAQARIDEIQKRETLLKKAP